MRTGVAVSGVAAGCGWTALSAPVQRSDPRTVQALSPEALKREPHVRVAASVPAGKSIVEPHRLQDGISRMRATLVRLAAVQASALCVPDVAGAVTSTPKPFVPTVLLYRR